MCASTAFESCPLDAQRIIILKSLSPSLSYSYLVLKQVFVVISEELSMACFILFFLFLIGSEKSVRMGRSSFGTLHQIVI